MPALLQVNKLALEFSNEDEPFSGSWQVSCERFCDFLGLVFLFELAILRQRSINKYIFRFKILDKKKVVYLVDRQVESGLLKAGRTSFSWHRTTCAILLDAVCSNLDRSVHFWHIHVHYWYITLMLGKKKKKQSQPFPNFSAGLVNDLPEGTPIICTARRKKMTHPLINSPWAPFARHFEFQNPPRLTLGLT